MIYTGIDLVEINRISHALRNRRFKTFVFGSLELNELEAKGFPAQSAAAAFAAKEAFGKALGTGVRGFSLSDVELLHDIEGKPYIFLSGNANKIANQKNLLFSVSISHTREHAVAIVIGYRESDQYGG